MLKKQWNARIREELIIEVWEALDCESVGARELLAIQEALRAALGAGAVMSPAAIARTVADEGAALRHPEVLNCDREWREQNLETSPQAHQFDVSTLTAAASSLEKIAELRKAAHAHDNQESLQRLRDLAIELRREAQLLSRSKIVTAHERAIAKEVSDWLNIWLQQPDLFADWLSLRQRSPEYQKKFQ